MYASELLVYIPKIIDLYVRWLVPLITQGNCMPLKFTYWFACEAVVCGHLNYWVECALAVCNYLLVSM